jgi:hypothetical protein
MCFRIEMEGMLTMMAIGFSCGTLIVARGIQLADVAPLQVAGI